MSLSLKITSLILLTLSLLMFAFGWFSILDEEEMLESVLDKHGNALTKVVSGFSVDPLLLEDYPVLETVLRSFGEREETILAIEVTHNGNVVASYRKPVEEEGRTFISEVEFNDVDDGIRAPLGEVRLVLSQRYNLEVIAERQAQILRYFVIAFLVLMLALVIILRKSILERIGALTRRIEKISSELEVGEQQSAQSIETESNGDEISILSSRFDAMVDRVRHHNRALREKVAERTADLEAAKETAERANQAKSRFLASASHDLRQPLQALSMYSGVLESKVGDPETLNVVERISNGIQTMNEMLTMLLDVSRLEAGVIVPAIRQLTLSALFDELEAEFSPLAETRGLAFRVCRTSLMTESDPVLLDRILRNLVSNAVRYTEQGKILLGCRRCGRFLRVEVHDSGIGIPADQIDEIFEDFHQLGNLARDRRLGLGLGLSVARGMVDLLGHSLSVHSLPGKGSCFAIELPRVEPSSNTQDETGVFPPMSGEGQCVLLIEDDRDVLDALHILLETRGYRVITAVSASDALRALDAGPLRPDIMIADYRLQDGENGAEAIVEVRSVCGINIPGILLTGDTAPERIASAARSGFTLLHKPIDPETLILTIKSQTDSGAAARISESGGV